MEKLQFHSAFALFEYDECSGNITRALRHSSSAFKLFQNIMKGSYAWSELPLKPSGHLQDGFNLPIQKFSIIERDFRPIIRFVGRRSQSSSTSIVHVFQARNERIITTASASGYNLSPKLFPSVQVFWTSKLESFFRFHWSNSPRVAEILGAASLHRGQSKSGCAAGVQGVVETGRLLVAEGQ